MFELLLWIPSSQLSLIFSFFFFFSFFLFYLDYFSDLDLSILQDALWPKSLNKLLSQTVSKNVAQSISKGIQLQLNFNNIVLYYNYKLCSKAASKLKEKLNKTSYQPLDNWKGMLLECIVDFILWKLRCLPGTSPGWSRVFEGETARRGSGNNCLIKC